MPSTHQDTASQPVRFSSPNTNTHTYTLASALGCYDGAPVPPDHKGPRQVLNWDDGLDQLRQRIFLIGFSHVAEASGNRCPVGCAQPSRGRVMLADTIASDGKTSPRPVLTPSGPALWAVGLDRWGGPIRHENTGIAEMATRMALRMDGLA
ncbi:unnamed protein product [Protopolystoma xenopodis]|uniref:Uncharacterized protein n=1 Tax=Protopolystoma xenopodis TaxID=117903 RepID=A0A448WSY9_9PLAT|nr:unnamed protein product [Protopolystoma xenopodis]